MNREITGKDDWGLDEDEVDDLDGELSLDDYEIVSNKSPQINSTEYERENLNSMLEPKSMSLREFSEKFQKNNLESQTRSPSSLPSEDLELSLDDDDDEISWRNNQNNKDTPFKKDLDEKSNSKQIEDDAAEDLLGNVELDDDCDDNLFNLGELSGKYSKYFKYLKIAVAVIIVLIIILNIKKIISSSVSEKNTGISEDTGEQETGEEKVIERDTSSYTGPSIIKTETLNYSNDLYQSYLIVKKMVEITDSRVTALICGETVDGVYIEFPISIEEYNTIVDNDIYYITYNKIKINGDLHLVNVELGGKAVLSNKED